MSEASFTLLIVDDEPNVIKSVKRLLFETDYKILTAESGEKGLTMFEGNEIDLVISDYRMPGMNGVEFLREVRERYPDTIRLILSGYADVAAVVEAINDGQVYKFISKPWNDQELLTTIMRALDQHHLERENRRLTEELRDRNAELEELTRSLEEKVLQRTRDLEIRNRALNVAHKLMDHLPIGVIGLNTDMSIAYINKSARDRLGELVISPGQNATNIICDDLLQMVQDALDSGKIKSVKGCPNLGADIIVSPLPEKAGAVCVIISDKDNAATCSEHDSNQQSGTVENAENAQS